MLAFLASVLLLTAACVQGHPVTMQRGAVSTHGWTLTEPAAATNRVRFHLALPQRNLDVLDSKFWAVSDPDSDDYGNFMSVEEIQALVSPPWAERQELIAMLVKQGVDAADIKDYGDSLEVSAPVSVATSLFDATFHVFQHESGHRLVRASSDVSVSLDIAQRIESVYGLTGFPVPHLSIHPRPASAAAELDYNIVIPQSLYQMYGLPRNTTVNNGNGSGISQGVIQFESNTFRPIDLLWYAANVSLNGEPVLPASQIIGNIPTQSGFEAELDIETIVGVAPGNTNWFWLEDNETTWLYGFSVHFLNSTAVPDVISISYGWYEGGQCDDGMGGAECAMLNVTSPQYIQRVDTQWQKIGVRGVSIIASSGDSGCHSFDYNCQAPTLLADYPASCPYITSVGGTEVKNATFFASTIASACGIYLYGNQSLECISGGTEEAVDVNQSWFTSGGGFSNISLPMDYQTSAVQAYLSQTTVPLPPAEMFNHKGRAYPDVSAVGHNGFVIQGGPIAIAGGTSLSSPIFAGVAALLNVDYKNITGSTLGFLNPLLYKMWEDNPSTFNDITSGDNICPGTGCNESCKGFRAAPGWDPVTGLGTPSYPTMVDYVRKLGQQVVARRTAKASKLTVRGVAVAA